jgi:hypothetical protein
MLNSLESNLCTIVGTQCVHELCELPLIAQQLRSARTVLQYETKVSELESYATSVREDDRTVD